MSSSLESPLSSVDLASPAVDWDSLLVPEGWEPVRDLCQTVAGDKDNLTETMVQAIQREIPAYRDLPAVPREDLKASVGANIELLLVGMAERRSPTQEELEIRRALGHRRAEQGQPVDAVIQAFEVGYREIWKALVEEAEGDAVTKSLLLQAVLTVWTWIQEVSNAVAEAYRTTMRNREALAAAAHQRFFDMLRSGDLESEELLDLTRSLGFDRRGEFQAALVRPRMSVGDEWLRLGSALGFLEGTSKVAVRGSDILVVCQKVSHERVLATVRNVVPDGYVGMGLRRNGLEGARFSLGDAERALAIASDDRSSVTFGDDWLLAVVNQNQERLRPILEKGRQTSVDHPEFAQTVSTFATSSLTVSETARAMNLHANTVVYRLKRWEELTGWNLKSLDGLVASVISMNLAWDK